MMLIAGTIPIRDLSLTMAEAKAEEGHLIIDNHHIPCTQGTGAMISAALVTTNYLKLEPPQVLVAGDIGDGKGSQKIYQYLMARILSGLEMAKAG